MIFCYRGVFEEINNGKQNEKKWKENEKKWKDESISSDEKQVTIKGWVRTIRDQKSFAFIEVNDGSSMKGLQVVMNLEDIGGKEVYDLSLIHI